jgi:3'(2'), 5'-bisphosphate nucleotidase
MESLTTLTNEACVLAELAGERIMSFYRNGTTVTWKGDASPLTSADRASHDFLMASLGSLTPKIPIVSEESVEAINGSFDAATSFWLVDPLDGTKEFLKGTNEFTVNVALVEQRRPVLGVVHGPALDVTYYGVQNSGFLAQKR